MPLGKGHGPYLGSKTLKAARVFSKQSPRGLEEVQNISQEGEDEPQKRKKHEGRGGKLARRQIFLKGFGRIKYWSGRPPDMNADVGTLLRRRGQNGTARKRRTD